MSARGVEEGRLAACGRVPHCVSSADSRPGFSIEPIPFGGSPSAVRDRLLEVLAVWPRTRIVVSEERYLQVECRSRFFGFVDDLELLIDEKDGVIQVRSCSRVGVRDLGVNRKRVERLRRDLLLE